MASTIKIWVNGSAPTCDDVDLNGFKAENNNLIIGAGIALSTADNEQTHRAVAHYAAGGDFYTDSGAANAYVLSVIGAHVAPPVYFTGMRIRWVPGNTNTGASTVNVALLGAVGILDDTTGAALLAGALTAGVRAEAYYSAGSFRCVTRTANSVTNANLADMGTQTIKGRTTAGTGDPEDLTPAQVSTMLGTVATQAGVETLTNKTLTSPKINQVLDSNGNEVVILLGVAPAVNEIALYNNTAGNAPGMYQSGADDVGIGVEGALFKNGDMYLQAQSADKFLYLNGTTNQCAIWRESGGTEHFGCSDMTNGRILWYYAPTSNNFYFGAMPVTIPTANITTLVLGVTAGDTVIYRVVGNGDAATNDTQYPNSLSIHYVQSRCFPIRSLANGTIRLKLEQFTDSAASTSYVRVLQNEVAQIEWTTASLTPVPRTLDITVAIGDVVVVQQRTSGTGALVNIQNCTVCASTLTAAVC